MSPEKRVRADFKKRVLKAAFDSHREIVQATPVDTGRLRQSVQVEDQGDVIVIGSNVDYAEHVELGTGIYGPSGQPIKPVRAKALSWIGRDGERVFRSQVAGYEGYGMFLKGQRALERALKKRLSEANA